MAVTTWLKNTELTAKGGVCLHNHWCADPSPRCEESRGKDGLRLAFCRLYKPEQQEAYLLHLSWNSPLCVSVGGGQLISESLSNEKHLAAVELISDLNKFSVYISCTLYLAQVDHGEDVWVCFPTFDPLSLSRNILILWTKRRQLRLSPPRPEQTHKQPTHRSHFYLILEFLSIKLTHLHGSNKRKEKGNNLRNECRER